MRVPNRSRFWDSSFRRRANCSDLTFTYTWRATWPGRCVSEYMRSIVWLGTTPDTTSRRRPKRRVVELTVTVPLRACATSASAWRHFWSIVISRSIKADEYRRSIFTDASGDASGSIWRHFLVLSTAWRDRAWRRGVRSSGVKRRCDAVHANAPRRPSITAANHTNCLRWLLSYRLYPLPEFRRSAFWSYRPNGRY